MEEFTIIKTPKKEIKFDNSKILKNWSLVLNTFKVDDEKLRLFFAIYAEYFLNQYGANVDLYPYPPQPPTLVILNEPFNHKYKLLPINLKILSRLNLKDKYYEIKVDIPEKHIGIPLSYKNYSSIKNVDQMDTLMYVEDKIVNTFVEKINSELEKNNEIYITDLIDSVMIKDVSSKTDESTETTSVWGY